MPKIEAFIDLINSDVERAEAVLIEVEQYKAFFKGKIGVTHDNPFLQGFMHIVQQCAVELPDPMGKIDFVFDEMDDTQYLELLGSYRTFKTICPDEDVKARLGAEPIRRDDKLVVALQAADLWIGLGRSAYEGSDTARALLKTIKIPNRCFLWDKARLEELWERSKGHVPNLALGIFYEDKKQRSERLAEARKSLGRGSLE